MKLYHCQGARSLRVVWALEELGATYEIETLQFPPRMFHKEYKAVNPLGTVPCLIDDELVMTESVGICEYLGVKHSPTPLAVAAGEDAFGEYLNWLHRSDATLTFPQTLVLRYAMMEPEDRRQPQVAEDYRQWFLGRWRSVEAALETREYLCANRFTMADICVGYALHLAKSLGIDEAFSPNVSQWWKKISARPAYQKAITL